MTRLLDRLTPRASRRARLLLAALAWTGIGGALLAAGCHWTLSAPSRWWLAGLPVALGLGYAKGHFLLAPRAAANARRIVASGERRCVAGFFGWGSYTLAACMMIGGFALRHSPVPRPWLGFLYAAVGVALLAASAESWVQWRRFARGERV